MASVLEGVQTALITGASGGIGGAFAGQLAALGKDLVLVARREDRLRATAEELSAQHGIRAHVVPMDLALSSAASRLFAETERQGLAVDLLINSAGFSRVGEFANLPFDTQADMVRVNINALTELARLYLPAMCRRRRGGIINLASVAAYQPVPYMSIYAATKAYVLHFSEGLAEEVRSSGVSVMALCPGATATEFWVAAGAWQERMDRMPTPDEVVEAALRAFEGGRSSYTHGLWNRTIAFSNRLAPRWLVARLAARVFRRHR